MTRRPGPFPVDSLPPRRPWTVYPAPVPPPVSPPPSVPPSVLVVIPARMASSRLPGKALLNLGGKPLVVRVWERVKRVLPQVEMVVATDHSKIAREVEASGGTAVMTSTLCRSGTDRAAEVVRHFPGASVVLNVQGDEPFIEGKVLHSVLDALLSSGHPMATAACPFPPGRNPGSPSSVKVVLNRFGDALYFSRSPIPHSRPGSSLEPLLHLGIYAYRADFLTTFSGWPESPLEQCEGLEQLRALENGVPIRVARVEEPGFGGVDTEDDLVRAREAWASRPGEE